MNPTLNILGISGSLRAQSRNTGLLRFAKQCLPPTVNFQIADLADVPFYNADRCDFKPEPVQTLIRQVTEADARAGLSRVQLLHRPGPEKRS